MKRFTLQDQIKKKHPDADKRTVRLAAFKRWIETVPGDQLVSLLCREIWHDNLKDTELFRFFVLETEYDQKMVHRAGKWRVKRCTAAGCDWFGLSRVLMRKCPECRGPVEEAMIPIEDRDGAQRRSKRRAAYRKKK